MGERAAMGQLLQADLLIIIHQPAEHPDQLEWSVCETKMGLHIAEAAALLADTQAAATTIAAVVQNAQSIKFEDVAIFAVPPLVCNDLNVKFAPLSAAYATIIENDIQRHGGAIVVELAEARAIADEIALGKGVNAKRPLPFYIEGSYQTKLLDDRTHQYSFNLSLRQGKLEVAVVEGKDLAETAAADSLRAATETLMANTDTAHAAPSTQPSDDEAAVLAARSAEFGHLGNWPEALAMAEASLLIKPDQPMMERHAIYIIGQMLDRSALKVEQKYDLFRLGLSHLEVYMCSTTARTQSSNSAKETDWTAMQGLLEYDRMQRLINKGRKDNPTSSIDAALLATAQRVMNYKQAGKIKDRSLEFLWQDIDWSEGTGDAAHDFALKLSFMRNYPDTFSDSEFIERFACWNNHSKYRNDSPELLKMIDNMAQLPTKLFQKKAAIMKHRLNSGYVAYGDYQPSSATRPAKNVLLRGQVIQETKGDVRYVPLQLTLDAPKQKPTPTTLPSVSGIIPAGEGVEAWWWARDLFLMREAGHLQWVTRIGGSGVCFDGKYLWAIDPGPNLTALVIDPKTLEITRLALPEEVAPITKGNLGEQGARVMFAAIAPGRVCLAGSFGRGWIGTLSLDPAKHAGQFHMFFQATRESEEYDEHAWVHAELAFTPVYMIRLEIAPKSPEEKPEVRVLLGRRGGHNFNFHHPLLIDVDAEKVDVVKDGIRVDSDSPRIYDDGKFAYWVDLNDISGPKLFRLNPASGRREIVGRPPYKGSIGKTSDGFAIDASMSSYCVDIAFCHDMAGPYTVMKNTGNMGINVPMFYSQFHGSVVNNNRSRGIFTMEYDPLPASTTAPTTAPATGN